MKNRIGVRLLSRYLDYIENGCALPELDEYSIILDLRDARARIKELESLSASQEEALGMMERGQL